MLVGAAKEPEAVEVDVDSLGDVQVGAAEHVDHVDRRLASFERCIAEVEVRSAEDREHPVLARDVPTSLAIEAREDRDGEPVRAAPRCGQRRSQ